MSFDSLEEYIWMLGYKSFYKQLHDDMWTGGYKSVNNWFWLKNKGVSTKASIPAWDDDQPDNEKGRQDCLQIRSSVHKFDDEYCDKKNRFICEKQESTLL